MIAMATRTSASPSQLRAIGIALLAGPIAFTAVVAYLLASDSVAGPAALDGTVQLVFVFAAAVCIGAALVTRHSILARIRAAEALRQQALYVTGSITSLALLESAMLLGTLTWFLSRSALPALLPAGLAFVIAALSLPSKEHFDSLTR